MKYVSFQSPEVLSNTTNHFLPWKQNSGINGLTHLIDVWAGTLYVLSVPDVWAWVQQSVVDDAIVEWRRRLHACIRSPEGHFECSLWQICKNVVDCSKLSLNLLVNKSVFRLSIVFWHFFHLRLRCGGIFTDQFITRLLLSLPVKEFWKLIIICGSYGQLARDRCTSLFIFTPCTVILGRAACG